MCNYRMRHAVIIAHEDAIVQEYAIVSGNEAGAFRLYHAPSDGTLELGVAAPLDHETADRYRLVVAAVDGGAPPSTGHVTVHVTVADSNDNRPAFVDATPATAAVREDAAVGTTVVRVTATDADGGLNGQVRYHVDRRRSTSAGGGRCHGGTDRPVSGRGGQFEVDALTGAVFTTRPLDFDVERHYELIVVAADRGQPHSLQTSAVVSIQVAPI